jgi:MFS family permease
MTSEESSQYIATFFVSAALVGPASGAVIDEYGSLIWVLLGGFTLGFFSAITLFYANTIQPIFVVTLGAALGCVARPPRPPPCPH